MQIFYRFIYHPAVNRIIRTLNRALRWLVPVKIMPSGTLRLPLSEGRHIIFNTNQTDPVAYHLYWDGVYRYEYLRIFESIIKSCNTFVDIGCNAGIFSLVGAKVNERLRVIAFDPTDSAEYYFQRNVAANGFTDRVHYHKLAVSDKDAPIDFFKVRNPKYPFVKFNLSGSSGFVEKPENFEVLRSQTVELDHFLESNYPGKSVDFVKIDAENAEPLIVKGMTGVLKNSQPIVVCEILFDTVLDDLEKLFREAGYRFFLHVDEKLVAAESLSEKSRYADVRNCFFVPPSKVPLIAEWLR